MSLVARQTLTADDVSVIVEELHSFREHVESRFDAFEARLDSIFAKLDAIISKIDATGDTFVEAEKIMVRTHSRRLSKCHDLTTAFSPSQENKIMLFSTKIEDHPDLEKNVDDLVAVANRVFPGSVTSLAFNHSKANVHSCMDVLDFVRDVKAAIDLSNADRENAKACISKIRAFFHGKRLIHPSLDPFVES